MQQVVHFDLHIEDEVARVEEFSEGGFGFELLGNHDVDLLCNLLQLAHSTLLNQAVGRWPQAVVLGHGGEGERVFFILEDEVDDLVDGVDGLVDLVGLVMNRYVVFVPDVDFALLGLRWRSHLLGLFSSTCLGR